MATSPDGSTIASAAADETIRLWKVFASLLPFSNSTSHFLGVASEQGEEGKENWEESSCVNACSKHQIEKANSP